MRGSFAPKVVAKTSASGFPVPIHVPSDRARSSSPVLDRSSFPQTSPIARTVEETERNINTVYLKLGRPLDLRYAYKVHGAALSPSWYVICILCFLLYLPVQSKTYNAVFRNYIWTEDFDESSSSTQQYLEFESVKAIAQEIRGGIKTSLHNAGLGSIASAEINSVRKKIDEITHTISPKSRLANIVMDMETTAVTRMLSIVKRQISRQRGNSYKFYAAERVLSPERYHNDINVMCRSLRRSDLFYTFFGHVVGKLLCEALYTKGDRVVNYMQLRMMRAEVARALQDAITFLVDLTGDIPVDRVGQPDAVSVYTYDGDVIILDSTLGDGLAESSTSKKRKAAVEDNENSVDVTATATVVSSSLAPTATPAPAPIFYNMQIFPPAVGLGPMLNTSVAPT
jgi:hypothetical protein